jgi:hypothetical protein
MCESDALNGIVLLFSAKVGFSAVTTTYTLTEQ